MKTIPNTGKCTQKNIYLLDILVQIDETNIEIFKKLQPLSCKQFEIGDFIVLDEHKSEQIIDKNLKPKTFSADDDVFKISECGKKIIVENKKLIVCTFKRIISNEDLLNASYFFHEAKKGVVVLRNDKRFDAKFISLKFFKENFKIIKD